MAADQPAGSRRLTREELRAQLERAREQIADLEANRGSSGERLIDSLAERMRDGFVLLSPDGVLLDVNPALCAMTGFSREELIGVGPPHPYWPPENRERIGDGLRTAFAGPPDTAAFTFMRKGGERFQVLITPNLLRDEDGAPSCLFAIIRDISELRRTEAALQRSNRELQALSSCNQALLRATDEEALLKEVCRIVCEEAGYRMAWVGYAEHDAAKSVRPVAWAGFEDGYLAGADITWANDERGRGPTGSCVRTGSVISTPEFASDQKVAAWREGALRRGYRSGIALPLKDEQSEAFGALSIYSAEPGDFTPAEVRLLEELAADLAFGITVLRARIAHEQRAATLRASEEKYRSLFNNAEVGMFRTRLDGSEMLDANKRFLEIFGRTRAEVLGRPSVIHWADPAERDEMLRGLKAQGRVSDFECKILNKQGEVRTCLTSLSLDRESGVLEGSIADISARSRAEDALRESEARYRTVVENAPVGIFESTPAGQPIYVSPAYASIFGYDSPAEMIAAVQAGGGPQVFYADPVEREQILRKVHDSGGGWTIHDCQGRRKDGALIDLRLHLNERRDAASGETHLFGFGQDVSAQKRAANTLALSAALLSHGERLAHVGSWEWAIASGSCVASAEWQRLHGLAGERFSNEEMAETCHEDDREAMAAALARTAAGEPYRLDHRIVHPKTHEVRYLKTYGEPLFDADGRLETVIGASLDVTERVHVDEVLYERERRLQLALGDTVAALGATVAMRDPYTASHELRVAALACLIAERLGWSAEAVERLRMAALVHDIGKIAVPAEILSKPARLSPTEFALIKAHSQAAYEILAPIDFGGPVAEIVYQHHERLDGSGYPRGLRGGQVLPGARVIAIADVVEAMVTHRPYRAALPIEEALAEIVSGSGSRYDAEACAAVLLLFRDEGFAFTD